MPGPDLPTILPLLFTGIIVGSLLRKANIRISWKMISLGSILGGLGNLAHAAALNMLQSQGTTPSATPTSPVQATRPFIGTSTASSAFDLATFLATSFIIGVLMVLAVLVTATLTMKLRGRAVSDEEE